MDEFVIEEDVPENGVESVNGGTPVCCLNDKLKAIRPFSESQLMDLYSNEELEANAAYVDRFLSVSLFLVFVFVCFILERILFSFCSRSHHLRRH